MPSVKTVFHVHTDYSDDCNASVEDILDQAVRMGVGCVTITDHDTIAGALALSRIAGDRLKVVVGEEISTSEGHLIGLFLREEIQPGLSPRRTAELIRDQGGLVIAPHPFNSIFGCSLRDSVYGIVDLLHAVEVCNAQNLLSRANRQAERFASQFRLPPIVGADVHHRGHLDACFQWMQPFEGPQGFIESLKHAHFVEGRHTLGYFVRTAWCIFRDRSGLGTPAGYGRNARAQRHHHRILPGHAHASTVPNPGA